MVINIIFFKHNKVSCKVNVSCLLKLQDKLAHNAKAIYSPHSLIGHEALMLPPEIYLNYAPNPWNPLNNRVYPKNFVMYSPCDLTDAQM